MSTPAPMPDAVLLDMDGTIVDSSAAVERAWAAFADDHGLDPPVLVTAGDVDHPKPAPDGYELAAARCGATPRRCLVLEDSEAGIRAGQDAGAEVMRVGTGGLTLAEVATELLSRLG